MVGVAARVGPEDPYPAQIGEACAFAERVPLPSADPHPEPPTQEAGKCLTSRVRPHPRQLRGPPARMGLTSITSKSVFDTDEQRFQFSCHHDLDLLTSDPANLVRSLGEDDNLDPQLTSPDQPGRAISTEEWA
jgi:hypothetical protein